MANLIPVASNLNRTSFRGAVELGCLRVNGDSGAQGVGGGTFTVSRGGNTFVSSDYLPGQAAYTFLRWIDGGIQIQIPSDAVRACISFYDNLTDSDWLVWSDGSSCGSFANSYGLVLHYKTTQNTYVSVDINNLARDPNVFQKYIWKNVADQEFDSDSYQPNWIAGGGYYHVGGTETPAVGNRQSTATVSLYGIDFVLNQSNIQQFLDTGVNPETSQSDLNTPVEWYYDFFTYSTVYALASNFSMDKIGEWHYRETTTKKVAFFHKVTGSTDQLILHGYSQNGETSPDGVTWSHGVGNEYETLNSKEYIPLLGKGHTSSLQVDTNWTNIPVFDDMNALNDYLNSAYDSQAEKDALAQAENISGTNPLVGDKDIGYDEPFSTLGDPDIQDVFTHQYVLDETALREINNIIFNDNTSMTDFIDGTACWGSNAISAIVSLIYYPFNVTEIVNTSSTNTFSVGLFAKSVVSNLKKVTGLRGTLDMGSVNFDAVYGDYRDYEPFRRILIYLPYCGVFELEVAKYIGKRINLRYAVDLTTGECMAILYANSIVMDTFNGYIGQQLPMTSTDQYQNSQSRFNNAYSSVLSAIGSTISGNPIGAVENVIGGALEQMSLQTSIPINLHGSFGPMISEFDRQYPTIYVAQLDTVVPVNEKTVVGIPSNQGGKLSSFSGFLQCSKVTMTSGATEEEMEMIKSELYKGIYV